MRICCTGASTGGRLPWTPTLATLAWASTRSTCRRLRCPWEAGLASPSSGRRRIAGRVRTTAPWWNRGARFSRFSALRLCPRVRIEQFHHGAVVTQGIAGAEFRDRRENAFQRGGLGGGGLQSRVFEKISHRIFGFGDAIGNEDEAVAGVELAAGAFECGVRERPHRHVAVRGGRC